MGNTVYQAIDLEGPAFRLLRLLKGVGPNIDCELFQARLDDGEKVDYHAISYTWGGTDLSHTVILDGTKFNVTWNLYAALYHAREEEADMIIWIDATCP
jgi:hypothetical protein